MTSPICPPRPPVKSNLENRSEMNRSTVTIELTTKCIEKVFVGPMITVENEDGVSSIKFNFKVFHKVHTYENSKDIYQKIGGKILSSSNQPESFRYSELNKVQTESQLTIDLSSKNVTLVVFESTRSRLNTTGTTSLEFKFTTESRICKKPICRVLENSSQEKERASDESSEQISSHYLKMNPKKSVVNPIYGTFSHQLSKEPNNLEKDLVTEELKRKAAAERSERISFDSEKEPKKLLANPIYGDLSYKPLSRLSSIPEEDLSDEELKAASESSEQVSSDLEKEPMKSTLTRSISDKPFLDAKTAKKSKNLLRRFVGLFSKCIAKNPQNNVRIKPLEYLEMQESPIYDKTQIKERTISEDSGYVTPLSSPKNNFSEFCYEESHKSPII